MEGREHRKAAMTGDRQSTFRRPGSGRHVQDASIKKQKHVKRAYSKLKQRLGEVKTYDLDALEKLNTFDPMASTPGDQVQGATGRLRDRKVGTSPPGDVEQRRGAPKRNRTKEKKAFFKKTRSGQPVMNSRINKLLKDLRPS